MMIAIYFEEGDPTTPIVCSLAEFLDTECDAQAVDDEARLRAYGRMDMGVCANFGDPDGPEGEAHAVVVP
jgi:hypothetical protein